MFSYDLEAILALSKLYGDVRVILEENISSIIRNPRAQFDFFVKMSRDIGIQPNPESLLSLISGFLWGLVHTYYATQVGREMDMDETKDFLELLKRWAPEMRVALSSVTAMGEKS
jgi:hypothetical protein